MTLCLILSTYSPVPSLSKINHVFKYANLLLKRCGKIGKGDIMILFQDIYGAWKQYKWINWFTSRKKILNWINTQNNLCIQQLQSTKLNNNNNKSMIDQLEDCINSCKLYHDKIGKTNYTSFVYKILLICNEYSLLYNNTANKSNKLHSLLSLCRIIPISINMLCLCSSFKNNIKYIEFGLTNNCCNVCYQQFYRSPNKKQHFTKSCHQIALKQIRVINCCKKYQNVNINTTNLNSPPTKKRKLNLNNDDVDDNDSYELNEILLCKEMILFWQSLIDGTLGIFRWIFYDFNQFNIDTVITSISNRIASYSLLRYLSFGRLLGQCSIYPSINNMYFSSPNNINNKIIKFEYLNEKQILFNINNNHSDNNNAYIKSIYQNCCNNNGSSYCPLNILQENNVNISIGCDVISILGFLNHNTDWIALPVLSRHFIIPYLKKEAYNNQNQSNNNNNDPLLAAKGADIIIFIRELLYKSKSIGLVNLNPASLPSWYGIIYIDKYNNGQYLLLDILSPYINIERLLQIQSENKPLPQYTIPVYYKINKNKDINSQQSILSVYDSVSNYFPTSTNIIKEFDKYIRLLKQKKILEAFIIGDSIRRRSLRFHIPHLIKHLLSITESESNQIKWILPQDNDLKQKLNVLLRQINKLQTDNKIEIVWNSPNKNKKYHKKGNKNRNRSHNNDNNNKNNNPQPMQVDNVQTNK